MRLIIPSQCHNRMREFALNYSFRDYSFEYSEKDLILYALGVGCRIELGERHYLYEGSQEFSALPAFGVNCAGNMIEQTLELLTEMGKFAGIAFDRTKVLHAFQTLEIYQTLQVSGMYICKMHVEDFQNKGLNSLIKINVVSIDSSGNVCLKNTFGFIVLGFGKGMDNTHSRAPTEKMKEMPLFIPEKYLAQQTLQEQAALYRMSGDMNPLHVDPAASRAVGFPQPILHGLCTLGFACRAVSLQYKLKPSMIKGIHVRFTLPVVPGQTLITEMMRSSPSTIDFRTKVEETGKYVLNGGKVFITPSSL